MSNSKKAAKAAETNPEALNAETPTPELLGNETPAEMPGAEIPSESLPDAVLTSEALTIDEIIKAVMAKRSYPGTEQNLYSYSKLCWENYQGKQEDFEDYNTDYTEEMATDALAAIAAAAALPSFEALRAGHVVARNDLVKKLLPLTNIWWKLRGHIVKAYPDKVDQDAMLTAAGHGYYKDATDQKWDKAVTLGQQGINFMTMYGAVLLAKGMPAGFPTTFAAANTAFLAQRAVFIAKETATKDGIKLKAEKNEAIYTNVRNMAESGKTIYQLDAYEKKMFTISDLLKQVRGNSPSGLKGKVTTGSAPVVPLADVLIYDVNNPDHFTKTDKDGKYELPLASGPQKVKVQAAGYVTQTFERVIDVGTKHRKSFSLDAEPMQLAA